MLQKGHAKKCGYISVRDYENMLLEPFSDVRQEIPYYPVFVSSVGKQLWIAPTDLNASCEKPLEFNHRVICKAH